MNPTAKPINIITNKGFEKEDKELAMKAYNHFTKSNPPIGTYRSGFIGKPGDVPFVSFYRGQDEDKMVVYRW